MLYTPLPRIPTSQPAAGGSFSWELYLRDAFIPTASSPTASTLPKQKQLFRGPNF